MNRSSYFIIIAGLIAFWSGFTDNEDIAFTVICLTGLGFIIYNRLSPDFPFALKHKKHQVSASQLAKKIEQIYNLHSSEEIDYEALKKAYKEEIKNTFSLIHLPKNEVYSFRLSLISEIKKIQENNKIYYLTPSVDEALKALLAEQNVKWC